MNRPRSAIATGLGVAAAVVGLAASAHAIGGGAFDPAPVTAAFTAVAVVAAGVARFGRWTFWRLVVASALAQPFLHVVLGGSGSHGHHAHHHHQPGMVHADSTMVAAHVVVVIVLAITLRWGVRWLQALPAIGRALLMLPRRVAPVGPQRVRFALPATPAVNDLAVLGTRGIRGPPR